MHHEPRWRRHLRTLRWVQPLGDDLRHLVRSIVRRPLVPAMVAAMMALAVGATATVFAALDPVFFRQPAGVVDPSSLRRLFNVQPKLTGIVSCPPVSALFDYPAYVADSRCHAWHRTHRCDVGVGFRGRSARAPHRTRGRRVRDV